MAVQLINWHYVTSADYKAAGTGDVPAIVANDLYFLSDTKQLYRGSELFSGAVAFYTTSAGLPDNPAQNVIYFNTDTLEGKVHNGTSWVDIIKPLGAVEEGNTDKAVSGKAVIDYVASVLADLGTDSVVSDLTWDKENAVITMHMADGSTTDTVVLDGVPVKLYFDNDTNQLTLRDVNDTQVGDPIALDVERFVKSGEYDSESQSIILYFDDAKTQSVTIPVGDLVDTYTAAATATVDMQVSSNQFTANVKVSADEGNQLEAKADGLFVPAPEVDTSGLIPKVSPVSEGNLPMLKADGTLEDSGVSAADLATSATKIYQGASLEEAVGENVPNNRDFCIVKVLIEGTTDKYSYTAYVYDGTLSQWVAMDGNVNAENVIYDQDIVITTEVGNIKLTNGQGTIPAKGKNAIQVWEAVFTEEKNPTITQPSVSVNCPQAGRHEVGSTVTPTYTATLNGGNYQYGPATGITATSWNVQDTDNHTLTTNTGSFDSFVVTDDTNYRIQATAQYGDGAIPVTNLGNNYDAGKIVAGSKTGNSAYITGYRAGFYGTLTSKAGTVDSALVRSLANKTNAAPSKGNTWNLSIPVGALRVVFAYPASLGDVASVIDVNGMNAEIKTAFTKSEVTVEGANGYTGIAYNVYVLDFAAANDAANTYKITL